MSWRFASGDDAVMAGVTGANDGCVVYPEYTAKRNRVMAIFTRIGAGDVPGRFAGRYNAVVAVLARLHDIAVIVDCTCP